MKYTYVRTMHKVEHEQTEIHVESPAPNFYPVTERYFPAEVLSEFQSMVTGRAISFPRLEILWRREDNG